MSWLCTVSTDSWIFSGAVKPSDWFWIVAVAVSVICILGHFDPYYKLVMQSIYYQWG